MDNNSLKKSEDLSRDKDYVPTDEWPDVTVMVEGFGQPSLSSSFELEKGPLEVKYDNGDTVRYEFLKGTVSYVIDNGSTNDKHGDYQYRAVEVRPGIFFVDFLMGLTVHAHDISLIVNTYDGVVTLTDSRFVNQSDEIRMATDFRFGRIKNFGEIRPLSKTEELVGKRIYYRYSETEHYEHFYLNPGTFVWHCVSGGELGLACADPVQVYALGDNIVLLHWSETVKPVESIVTIDLEKKRSIGRMFCWDGPTLDYVHIPFDSKFTILSDVKVPID